MKKFLITIGTTVSLVFVRVVSLACDVCEKRQPAALKGIAHGAGPQSDWDYLIVGATLLIVVGTLYYSVKWILFPGEREENHIKRRILKAE